MRGSSGSAVFGACKNMWRSAVGPERTFGSAAAADEQQVAGSAQAAAPVADGQEASWVGKRLHIGNLPAKVHWRDLRKTFGECGQVSFADIIREGKGESIRWGVVEYATADEARKAITTMNGAELNGSRLLVREDREGPDPKVVAWKQLQKRSGKSSGLQVMVFGIPYSYDAEQLKSLFADINGIEQASIVTGYDGHSKGFGIVRFTSAEGVKCAIAKRDELHQQLESSLDGRKLIVRLDRLG